MIRIILERPEPPEDPPALKHCPTCGAKTVEYRHRLNRGLVAALRRLERLNRQIPWVQKHDLRLDTGQYGNFQKLQYWGFIEKLTRGKWRITDAGRAFLRGEPAWVAVYTYRSVFARFDIDAGQVTAEEVDPTYRQHEDYVRDEIARSPDGHSDQARFA